MTDSKVSKDSIEQAQTQIINLKNELTSQLSAFKKFKESDLERMNDKRLYTILEFKNLIHDICSCCENSLKNIESVKTSGIADALDREALIKSILGN